MTAILSKDTILRTAVCYWSEEDECFVVESPLFPRTAGTGASVQKAWKEYRALLALAYEHLKKNNVAGYNKAGRPAKGGIELHVSVRPATKESIGKLSQDLEISQGELIDFLLFFWEVRKNGNINKSTEVPNTITIQKQLAKIDKKLSRLDQEVQSLGAKHSTKSRQWKVAER
jgi:predicted RNase H-like HicB family nuclease